MHPRARLFVLAVLTCLMALPHAGQALLSVHDRLVVAPVPVNSTPHVLDGEVLAILPVGPRVYVGGNFTQVRNASGPAILAGRGLFAFDAPTGLVDPAFVADFDGAVEALAAAPDGRNLFVGGDFGTLNGLPRRKLAKISGTNAAPAADFSVSVTSAVNDVVVSGNRLIFAGAFSTVNGVARGGLAAVSVTTGALDPDVNIAFTTPRRGPNPRVRSIAVSPDGATLAAVGNFAQAGGQPRFQIALVDLAARPARVLDWQTSRFDDRHTGRADPDGLWCSVFNETFMRDVDISPDGKYLVVVTTGRFTDKGPLCDAASRWELSERGSGLQPTWVDWTGGDTLTAVAVTDAAEGADLRQMDFVAGRVRPGTLAVAAPGAGLSSRALFLVPRPAPPIPPPPPPAPLPPATPPPTPAPAAPKAGFAASQASGYWMVGRDGAVYAFGAARHHGDAKTRLGRAEAVDLEPSPSPGGYWILDTAGRVHSFGVARHYGDAAWVPLPKGEQATGLSATPSGGGYWIFTTRGRVLAFGDAGRFGDLAGVPLNGPVVDSIRTPSGRGYYLTASDGGIFTFGDARFHGSMGGQALNGPVQALVPDGDGAGYWLVASDGGVFAFGAPFRGSMGGQRLNQPVTGMVPFGQGYLMVAADGGIFNFSDRAFAGSLGANPPAHPVVAVAGLNP